MKDGKTLITDIASCFSSRLKTARELRGLSQVELASIAKIPSTSIAHFESGSRKPSLDNLIKLVAALEISADYLIGVASEISEQNSTERLAVKYQRMTKEQQAVAEDILDAIMKRRQV